MTLYAPSISTHAYRSNDAAVWFEASASSDGVDVLHAYPTEKHPDGGVIIRGMEIFAPTTRKNPGTGKLDVFDESYCRRAIQTFSERRARGYMPPVHTKHLPRGASSVQLGAENRLIGFLDRIYEDSDDKGGIVVKGDIWVPNAQSFRELAEMRWPYRSVEILDPNKAEFSSLALLDVNVPYFKFPLTRVDASAVQQFCAQRQDGAVEIVQRFSGGRGPTRCSQLFRSDVDFANGDDDGEFLDDDGEPATDDEALLALLDELGLLDDDMDDGSDDGSDMDILEEMMASEDARKQLVQEIVAELRGPNGLDQNGAGAQIRNEPSAPPMVAQQAIENRQQFAQVDPAVLSRIESLERLVKAQQKGIEERDKTIQSLQQFAEDTALDDKVEEYEAAIVRVGNEHYKKLVDRYRLNDQQRKAVAQDFAEYCGSAVDAMVQVFSESGNDPQLPDVSKWAAKWDGVFAGSTIPRDDSTELEGVMPAAATFSDAAAASAQQFCEQDSDCKQLFEQINGRGTAQAKISAMKAAKDWDANRDGVQEICSRAGFIEAAVL